MMILREITKEIEDSLNHFPAVALLGPRQCGKSTLAKSIISKIPNSLYLDLENPIDIGKLIDPVFFFKTNSDKLICLDEIQRLPQIFSTLRSIIDENNKNKQFLILGSASPDLLKQSSESLAGRIIYKNLTPLNYNEIKDISSLTNYWLRGGFPRSILAKSDFLSFDWLNSFIVTFLERDIPQFGIKIPINIVRRLWQMCAHLQGQTINYSKLSESLGVSNVTVRNYLEILSSTYMIRLLPPFEINLKKRLIKSPKVYIRDTGILNALLNINDFNSLLGHPAFGASWEVIVIEHIIETFRNYNYGFYRTQDGAEVDIVIDNGIMRFAIECKSSITPKPTRGFWNSIDDLKPDKAYIAAPIDEPYSIAENVSVGTFEYIIKDIQNYIISKNETQTVKNHEFINKLNKL